MFTGTIVGVDPKYFATEARTQIVYTVAYSSDFHSPNYVATEDGRTSLDGIVQIWFVGRKPSLDRKSTDEENRLEGLLFVCARICDDLMLHFSDSQLPRYEIK